MKISTLFAATVAMIGLLFMMGCGGGSAPMTADAPQTGRAVITVKWPESSSRLIPAGANSIRVTFLVGTITLQSQIIARPTTSATFTNLPSGTLIVQAAAFPTTDATGSVQAKADSSAVIVAGQKTPVNLTLATTIASVKITPETIQFTGDPVTLTATAFDGPNATGNIILSSAWTWANSQPRRSHSHPPGRQSANRPGQRRFRQRHRHRDRIQ